MKFGSLRVDSNRILVMLILGIFVFMVLFPFYWMACVSLKSFTQMYSGRSLYFPNPVSFENYRELFQKTKFFYWFRNSIIVSFGATLISLAVGCLGGYSLSRLSFFGRSTLSSSILITYLMPPSILFIPLYYVLRSIGLINTLWSLIVVYPTFAIPLCTWLMMGFFRTIPRDLEEAALTDGATRMQSFFYVILPICTPGILAAGLNAFILAWNEFLYALVFIQDAKLKTLSVGIQELIMGDVYLWQQLMAASVITTIPVVGFFIYLQRYMIEGLMMGAVKG
jgi:multiple sugar transport system permease protein